VSRWFRWCWIARLGLLLVHRAIGYLEDCHCHTFYRLVW
jgi:hypothetical protein